MKRITLLFVSMMAWAAQEPVRVTPLQFDAASVKRVPIENLGPSRISIHSGSLRAQSVSIGALIAYAYGVQPPQILGLNPELGRYDLEGKSDGAYSRGELCVMLQGLLAERFHLKFHREMREMGVDRLVIGKDLKLKPSESTEPDPRGYRLHASEGRPGFLNANVTAMSMEWLADNLSGSLSRLVVDATSLEGLFQFDVDFEFDSAEAADVRVPEREVSKHIREGLVSALGLKLQGSRKAQVEVLVIDHVDRPEAN